MWKMGQGGGGGKGVTASINKQRSVWYRIDTIVYDLERPVRESK